MGRCLAEARKGLFDSTPHCCLHLNNTPVTLCKLQTAKCYLSHCANCHKEARKGLFDDAAHCCLLHPPTTHLSHFVQIVQKCATSCHTVQSVRCVNCAAYGSPTEATPPRHTCDSVQCDAHCTMHIVHCRFCSVTCQQCAICTVSTLHCTVVCYSNCVVSTL